MSRRNTYFIAPTVVYDADAEAYFTAAGITDDTEKEAYNDFVVNSKLNSIYTKYRAFYPLLGSSATSAKFNAITPLDTDAAFRLQFFGGWVFGSTGATPNGTTAYCNSFFTPSINAVSQDSLGIHKYTRSNIAGGFGCYEASFSHQITMFGNAFQGMSTPQSLDVITQTTGLYSNVRDNAAYSDIYLNGVVDFHDARASVGNCTYPIYFGAPNIAGSDGIKDNAESGLYAITDGLSGAEMTIFNSLVQQLMTDLSRNA